MQSIHLEAKYFHGSKNKSMEENGLPWKYKFRGSMFYLHASKITFVEVKCTSMEHVLLEWKRSSKETQTSQKVVDRVLL